MRFRLAVFLALALAGCHGAPPNSAVPEELTKRDRGLEATTPLAAIIRDQKIRDVDPAQPLLPQIERELAKTDPAGRFRGVTYEVTRGNALDRDWLVQSPTIWGRKASDVPAGHSDALVERVRRLIASARRSVDIGALSPAPDGRFLDAINAGLREAASRGQPIEVRVLIGHYPTEEVDAQAFLKKLHTAPQLSLHVSSMRSCTAFDDCDGFSWNHSKIIAVDGRVAMVGGHNLWTEDYLVDRPVHDLSMVVRGPAAAAASRFLDELWRFVCANAETRKPAVQLAGTCPPSLGTAPSPRAGNLDIMSIGRLGVGITKDFANHSELARDLMIGAARKTVHIVQQDVGFKLGRSDTLFPETTLEQLVDFMIQGGDVYMVLSNSGALGNTGSTYTNDVSIQIFARRMREITAKRFERLNQRGMVDQSPQRGPDQINAVLCSRLRLATLRFGPDDKWPKSDTFAQHAKMVMIDERAFYIGSDNMYPVNLQELGYIVDDRATARHLIDTWWNPMWQWSQRAAISGPDVQRCVFREVPRT